MKTVRPGSLAIRAVNQYRRRDVLTYLALRYYLHNAAARSDNWARQVATDLVLSRTDLPYFRALHFKDTNEHGEIGHRAIFLPSANEALAESALLDECANHPDAFANPACVYSYELSRGKERSGIFTHYFGGLRARQQAIAEACDAYPQGVVRYTDIKRFYPSIGVDLAISTWQKQSELASLSANYRDLGDKLISEHGKAGQSDNSGILTGPMFSHLLGNLILRELDEECSKSLPAKYFRYVDDIILVGESDAVARSLKILGDRLADLGLMLHDDSSPKSISVPTREWIKGRNDFRDSRREISWMTLIADLKQFLLLNPGGRENLQRAFRSEGFRIPVRDYTGIVHESSYIERVLNWAPLYWFRRKAQSISIQTLLKQARWLRKAYEEEFRYSIDGAAKLGGFDRKRIIPKLRYRAGRLAYLAAEDTLASLCPLAEDLPELHFHCMVMEAIASGNIDRLLTLGSNAAQAAAQPLRAAGKRVATTLLKFSEAEEQALAVFLLNGVTVDRPDQAQAGQSDLMRFATEGANSTLMKNADPFMRELSCLHGLTEQPRHPELLETAFDEDEDLAMDAIDQLQQSLSP